MTDAATASRDAAVRQLLQEGETVLRVASIHSGIYWKGIVLFLISVFLMITVFNLGAFLMFVSLLMLSVSYLTKYYLLLAMTDKRVMIRHGIINLDTIQMMHSRIESVELDRTIMARILGYSTVLITGTGSRVIAIPFVADGDAFRAQMNEIIFAREDKMMG